LCAKAATPRFPLCADCNDARVMADQYNTGPPFTVPPFTLDVVEEPFGQPLSGGSNDYWKVRVGAPVSGSDAYTAECNDLIEALQMTYAEGNVFKAVWRHALARRGIGKQGNTQRYEAEKAEFFAKRLVELTKG
jgi:hypothetical protein